MLISSQEKWRMQDALCAVEPENNVRRTIARQKNICKHYTESCLFVLPDIPNA